MPDYAAGFRYNMLTPFAMNKNHYVVGLGEILWDKFGETKRLGGAPANFAYHASRFGHEGLVVSAIGNDGDGDDIVAELERKRLAHHLERVDSPTGTGDAFTGAFVGSLLSGASIREAHAVAVHVAAYVCTREGAMPPVPEGMLA